MSVCLWKLDVVSVVHSVSGSVRAKCIGVGSRWKLVWKWMRSVLAWFVGVGSYSGVLGFGFG